MKPTPEEIEEARTPNGGWTRETLESWGVGWPPKRGWKDELLAGQSKPITLAGHLHGLIARLEVAAGISKLTESPIETMLGLALAEHLKASGVHWSFVMPDDGWEYGADHWCLIPQLPWRRYRIDWAIRRAGKLIIFIECDGKEFHTAPEDVERDKIRDAAVAAAGIQVIRFTGAEIFADASMCALKVIEVAR